MRRSKIWANWYVIFEGRSENDRNRSSRHLYVRSSSISRCFRILSLHRVNVSCWVSSDITTDVRNTLFISSYAERQTRRAVMEVIHWWWNTWRDWIRYLSPSYAPSCLMVSATKEGTSPSISGESSSSCTVHTWHATRFHEQLDVGSKYTENKCFSHSVMILRDTLNYRKREMDHDENLSGSKCSISSRRDMRDSSQTMPLTIFEEYQKDDLNPNPYDEGYFTHDDGGERPQQISTRCGKSNFQIIFWDVKYLISPSVECREIRKWKRTGRFDYDWCCQGDDVYEMITKRVTRKMSIRSTRQLI